MGLGQECVAILNSGQRGPHCEVTLSRDLGEVRECSTWLSRPGDQIPPSLPRQPQSAFTVIVSRAPLLPYKGSNVNDKLGGPLLSEEKHGRYVDTCLCEITK